MDGLQLGPTLRMLARDGLLLLLVVRVGGAPADLAGAGLAALAAVHVARAGLLAGQRTVLARTVWPLAWRHLRVPGLAVPAERPVSRRARPGVDARSPRSSTCPWRRDCCWWRPGRPVHCAAGRPGSARSSRSPSASPAARCRASRPGAATTSSPPCAPRRGPRTAGRHLLRGPAVEHPRAQRVGAGAGAAGRAGARARPPAGAPRPAGQHAAAGRVAAPARGRRGPGRAVDRARDVPHQHHPEQPPDPRPRHHRRVRRHGDSDKGELHPLSRIYDEVWVAGPAGRDRYRLADVGVRDEQVREVGRPRLAEITRAADGSPATPGLFTVLYAPTWEGFYAEYSYSSLQVMGERLVRGCSPSTGARAGQAAPGVRLGRPGVRDGGAGGHRPRAAGGRAARGGVRGDRPVRGLQRGRHAGHRRVQRGHRLPGLAQAVRHDQPASAARGGLPPRVPVICGAALWAPDLGTLADDVADARGADVRRADRERVAAYLLGADEGDPVHHFAAAVTELVGR